MKLFILAAISLIAIGCSKEDKQATSTTKLTLAQIEATNEQLSAKKNQTFDDAIKEASGKLGAPETQTAESAAYSFSASMQGKDGCGPKPAQAKR